LRVPRTATSVLGPAPKPFPTAERGQMSLAENPAAKALHLGLVDGDFDLAAALRVPKQPELQVGGHVGL
jgi:hypothetical protein